MTPMFHAHPIRRCLALLAGACAIQAVHADSVTLIPVADTSLFQIGPDNNMGANLSGVIGTSQGGDPGRLLVRFDLESKIPTNAILKSVSITFKATRVRNASLVPVSMHRMLVGWNEGSGGKGNEKGAGDAAAVGETTWNDRISPGVPWSSPGAAAASDYAEAASGTSTAAGVGSFTFSSNASLLSDVAGWVQNPASNFGWILLAPGSPGNGSAKRIGTRESAGKEPILVIEFDVPKPVEPLVAAIPPDADTYLFEEKPDNNFGTASQLRVGRTQSKRARVLFRFDLQAALPTNAVITNATLAITVIKAPGNGGAASSLELHPMLRSWNEGTQFDGPASAGEPSWFVNASPDSFWGDPGGDAGVDFSDITLSTTPIDSINTYVFPSTPLLVQQLQQWLNFPQHNFGFLMSSSLESTPQTARGIASRESESGKPELRIGYFLLTAEEAPKLLGIHSTDGKLLLHFQAAPRIQAILERSPSLTQPRWSEVSTLVGNPAGTENVVEVPSTADSGFYRLRVSGRNNP